MLKFGGQVEVVTTQRGDIGHAPVVPAGTSRLSSRGCSRAECFVLDAEHLQLFWNNVHTHFGWLAGTHGPSGSCFNPIWPSNGPALFLDAPQPRGTVPERRKPSLFSRGSFWPKLATPIHFLFCTAQAGLTSQGVYLVQCSATTQTRVCVGLPVQQHHSGPAPLRPSHISSQGAQQFQHGSLTRGWS
jgi:hypothetical protein